MAQKFLTNVELEAGLVDGSDSTGTSGYLLSSTGTATSWVDPAAVSVGESEQVHIACKNTSGIAISKGDPVYITGTVGASFKIEIAKADASDSAKMPAVGLAETDLGLNAEGFVIVSGVLKNLTTDPLSTSDGTPSSNDTVYVKAGGGLTRTKPTGSANLIQNVGKVGRVNSANAGSLAVSTIMRTNDVPNLTTGKIWVGSPTYTTESTVVHLDETNGRMGIGTTSPSQKLEVDGNIQATGSRSISSLFDANHYMRLESNSSGGILKGTDGGVVTTLVRTYGDSYFNSGNVGIGTTSPSTKLSLAGNSSGAILSFKRNNTTTTGAKGGLTWIDSSSYYVAGISALGDGTTDNSGELVFRTSTGEADNTDLGYQLPERMRIDSSGNVGIGTTSPGAALDVSSSSTSIIRLSNSDTALTEGQKTGSLEFYQSDTSGNGTGVTGRISMSSAKNGSNENYYGNAADMVFQVAAPAGFASDNATLNALTIKNSSGNVGIGTTIASQKLHVAGNARVTGAYYDSNNSAGTSGQVLSSTGSATSWVSGSGLPGGPYLPLAGGTMTGDLLMDGKAGVGNIIGLATGTLSDAMSLRLYTYNNIDPGGGLGTSTGNMIEAGLGSNLVLRQTANDGDITFQSDDGAGGIATYLTLDGSSTDAYFSNPGNVGIGTTSPQRKFHVGGIARIEANAQALDLVGTDHVFIGFYPDGPAAGRKAYIGFPGATSDRLTIANEFDDDISFFTNGSEKVTIENSGDVGIGITSPAQKLHVIGNSEITGDIFLGRYIFHNDDTNTWFGFPLSDTISFRTNGSDRMYINSSGNVGIGTTSPGYKLDVNGEGRFGDNGGILLTDDSGTSYVRALNNHLNLRTTRDADDIYFSTGTTTTTKMFIKGDTGNVGVGTTSPGYKLDVNGSIRSGGKYLGPSSGYTYLSIAEGNFHQKFYTRTNTGAASERFTIEGGSATTNAYFSNVNVGIGTTSPSQKLTIKGTDQYVAAEQTNYAWGATNTIGVRMGTDTTAGLLDFRRWTGTGATHGTALITQVNSDGGYGLDFRVDTKTSNTAATTSRMFLSQSGEVGIGTTSPSEKLHVSNGKAYVTPIAYAANQSAYALKIGAYNNAAFDMGLQAKSTSGGSPYMSFRTSSNDDTLTIWGGSVGVGGIGIPSYTLDVDGVIRGKQYLRLKDTAGTNRFSVRSETTYSTIDNGTNALNYIANTHAFLRSSTEIMRIHSNSNVGIGTTNPVEKLDVNGDARVTGRIYTNAGGLASIGILGKAATNGWAARYDSNNANYSGFFFNFSNDASMLLRDDAGNVNVYLNSDSSSYINGGNFGIGTAGPSAKLDVASGDIRLATNSTYFRVRDTAGAQPRVLGMNATNTTYIGPIDSYVGGAVVYGVSTNVAYHGFYGGGSEKVRITSGGNVGIATTSPSEKLEVDGHVKAVDGYKGYVPAFQHGGFYHSSSSSSSSIYWLPTNYISETTSNQYYNTWIAPYDGRVKKIIMRWASGSTPTATSVNIRYAVNNTTSTTSFTGTLVDAATQSMKFTKAFGDTDITFSEGDKYQLGFTTDGGSRLLYGFTYTIVVEYNIT